MEWDVPLIGFIVVSVATKRESAEEAQVIHPLDKESRVVDCIGKQVHALSTFSIRAINYFMHMIRI